jgi:hypothetical protein
MAAGKRRWIQRGGFLPLQEKDIKHTFEKTNVPQIQSIMKD